MVSEVQLLANRENGKLGGVKTEAGKKISSKNAITHGILSKLALIPDENAKELNTLRKAIMAHYEPQGAMEILLADVIIANFWRWRRVVIVETDDLELAWYQHGTYSSHDLGFRENVTRYETTIERRIYKAMNELERIQDIRKGKNVPPRLSVDVDMSPQD
jgi:hypothetical protein